MSIDSDTAIGAFLELSSFVRESLGVVEQEEDGNGAVGVSKLSSILVTANLPLRTGELNGLLPAELSRK